MAGQPTYTEDDMTKLFGSAPAPETQASPSTPSGPTEADMTKLFGQAPAQPPEGSGWWQTVQSQALPTAKYVGGRIMQGMAEAAPPSLPLAVTRLTGLTPTPSPPAVAGEAPNPVARFAGGAAEYAASQPGWTAMQPWSALRGAVGAEAGHELFPKSTVAPIVGGALGGATKMPMSAAGHGGSIGGLLLGEAGADWLQSAMHSLGHAIPSETAKFLAPLLGYTLPQALGALGQVIRHPLMLLHPAMGGVMGGEKQQNQLSRQVTTTPSSGSQGHISMPPTSFSASPVIPF